MSNTHTYLYADDTSIFCICKDITEFKNVLNKEFANVCDWFVDNKLSINVGKEKTKCILFSRDKNLPELNITCSNNKRVTHYRMVENLGILSFTTVYYSLKVFLQVQVCLYNRLSV